MATINAINSNIPIQVTLGGTNTTSFATTDGTVYYNGTNLATTATGSANMMLTSKGTGVAPSYFLTPGMKLLQTQTASSSANITFTSSVITSSYKIYLLTFTDVQPASSSVMNMDWSVNNGSSYLNSGFASGVVFTNYNSAGWGVSDSTSTNPLSTNNASTNWLTGFLYLFNLATALPPYGLGRNSVNNAGMEEIYCYNSTTGTVNNIRLSQASGNIATGKFSLYGIQG